MLHSLAEPGTERLGLAGWRLVRGDLILAAGVVCPDLLDRANVDQLCAWAAIHPLDGPTGPVPVEVETASTFGARLASTIYQGRGRVVGFDLGRTLGLIAAMAWRSKRHPDSWRLGLPGWGVPLAGKQDGRARWNRATGRPVIDVASLGARGLLARFGTPRPSFEGRRRGEWDRQWIDGDPTGQMTPYPGRFLDLLPAAFSLDGTDDDDLGRHLAAWGTDPLPPGGPHHSARPDPAGAALVLDIVDRLHRLALAVDAEARAWRLDPGRLSSPGTAASHVLTRAGVRPPLGNGGDGLDDRELAHWSAASHGGLVEADPAWCGRPFLGADVDVRSAYPAVSQLVGWWRFLTAEQYRTVEVTELLTGFLDRPDLAEAVREPAAWHAWGLTRAVVELDGQPAPVRVEVGDRLVLRPTWGVLDLAWADVVAATILSGRPPRVIEGRQVETVGQQTGLRSIPTPGGRIPAGADPVPALFHLRAQAKGAGEWRRAAHLRVLLNAATFGNPARVDPDGTGDKPGPWCWPPLAASVTAGCRLLLAMLRAEVDADGGCLPYLDTDGAVAAGIDPDRLALILARFDRLSPWDGPLWATKDTGPVVVWGPKRYRFLTETASRSEHSVGGHVPPPSCPDQDPRSGHHEWLAEGTRRLAEVAGTGDLLGSFAWETASSDDWPALQRSTVSTPAAVAELPKPWGARPFARVVTAVAVDGAALPVALDPGGDLAGWERLDWSDARTGERITVTTDPTRAILAGAALVETLRGTLVRWADPDRLELPAGLLLDARLRALRGRSAGRFSDGDAPVVYRRPSLRRVVVDAARALGTVETAGLLGVPHRTVTALVAGRVPSRSTSRAARHALRDRLGPDYLAALLDLADEAGAGRCARPGCDKRRRPRSSVCSEACRKAVARARSIDPRHSRVALRTGGKVTP